jgi:hypothetical protein
VPKRNKKKREISMTFFIFLPVNYRESEKSYVLDEDDYELLQESNITVHRPKNVSIVFSILFFPFTLKFIFLHFWLLLIHQLLGQEI